MKKMHRGEVTVAKEIIYPEKKTNLKLWHMKNLQSLREKEERNRLLKEKKEQYVPPEPYKLKQFKNVQSKLYEQTKEWINNEKKQKPKSQLQAIKPPRAKPKMLNQVNCNRDAYPNVNQGLNTVKDNNEQMSMFERYYAEKLRSKSPQIQQAHSVEQTQEEENIYNQKNNVQPVQNTVDNNDTPLLNEEEEAKMKELLKHYNEQLEELNKEEEKEKHLKGPTPTVKDAPLILPKIQKNYLYENRKIISEHKVQSKVKPKEAEEPAIHKNYGKTPQYLEKYKKEAEMKKEIIKKMKEKAKYPKGTKLLTEEERLTTLAGLMNTKKELNTLLEKMPITTRTMAIQNKKDEIAKKLEELDKAIEMFSKKQVFIKVDE